jgi:hypothetical protein
MVKKPLTHDRRSLEGSWVADASPLSTYEKLVERAWMRYGTHSAPWEKEEDLDQADLVYFEEISASFRDAEGTRGAFAACIERLIEEVRRARGYPAPPRERAASLRAEEGR